MSLKRIALLAFAALLCGCDPGVQIAWEKEFEGTIDHDCVEDALRTVAPDVKRTTWLDEKRGVEVTQFYYSDPTLLGGYILDLAPLKSGNTHYEHLWSKLGTKVPPDEERKVLPLLNRANEAVARKCGLSFSGVRPVEGASTG